MTKDRAMTSRRAMTQQLAGLGVPPGAVLLVHCSFSRVGPVEGGPEGLVAALRDALGTRGTLVMPSMTSDDDHVFDPRRTPCRELGVVADTFWRLPGVLRADSPHAVAAAGPEAPYITQPHPVDVPHGPESPVGRVYELDGFVLLLGVGHTSNTTIHLAETVAGVRYRRRKHTTIRSNGHPVRVDYLEIDHCCRRFSLVDEWLDAERLQRREHVGHAEARLVRSRDVVRVVVDHLRANETEFLHPLGVDEECDDARASLGAPDA